MTESSEHGEEDEYSTARQAANQSCIFLHFIILVSCRVLMTRNLLAIESRIYDSGRVESSSSLILLHELGDLSISAEDTGLMWWHPFMLEAALILSLLWWNCCWLSLGQNHFSLPEAVDYFCLGQSHSRHRFCCCRLALDEHKTNTTNYEAFLLCAMSLSDPFSSSCSCITHHTALKKIQPSLLLHALASPTSLMKLAPLFRCPTRETYKHSAR
jgi:hypothetical protein